MTYRELLRMGEEILKKGGIGEYRIDAFNLLEHIFGMNKTEYLLQQCEQADNKNRIDEYLEKIQIRAKHIPLQHITSKQQFMGLEFYVDENVLIPRWDTEILVEKVLEICKNIAEPEIDILDMCTGSGCIGISIKKLCMNSRVTAVDLSEKALEIARKNADALDAGVTFVKSDLFEKLGNNDYNIIVSNPPYIRTDDINGLMDEVRLHEPFMALDGSEDGLKFYRSITAAAVKYLKKGGCLIYEIGHDQADEVRAIMQKNGFDDIVTIKDLAGLDRVVYGRLGDGGIKDV